MTGLRSHCTVLLVDTPSTQTAAPDSYQGPVHRYISDEEDLLDGVLTLVNPLLQVCDIDDDFLFQFHEYVRTVFPAADGQQLVWHNISADTVYTILRWHTARQASFCLLRTKIPNADDAALRKTQSPFECPTTESRMLSPINSLEWVLQILEAGYKSGSSVTILEVASTRIFQLLELSDPVMCLPYLTAVHSLKTQVDDPIDGC